VPLQALALEALDQLPESDGRPLFPAARGGHIDLHNFRAREWRPAQIAAGIEPIRRPYDLRQTYATFALRAGVSIFDLSRFMGASLAMIDKHYGHLAATAASMPPRSSMPTLARPPRGRQMDVGHCSRNPHNESDNATT
jgi:integrase